MLCKVCNDKGYALDLCGKHYKAQRRYGNAETTQRPRGSLSERFWAKVDKQDGCWEWMGAKAGTGYGSIQAGGRGSKSLLAHRVSYSLSSGAIPEGLYILHSCDNRSCVNPAHLRAGTNQENIQEAYDKGRKISPFKNPENRYRG